MARLETRYGRAAVVGALRAEADAVRGRPPDAGADGSLADAIEAGVEARLALETSPSLRSVINASSAARRFRLTLDTFIRMMNRYHKHPLE